MFHFYMIRYDDNIIKNHKKTCLFSLYLFLFRQTEFIPSTDPHAVVYVPSIHSFIHSCSYAHILAYRLLMIT